MGESREKKQATKGFPLPMTYDFSLLLHTIKQERNWPLLQTGNLTDLILIQQLI